MTLSSICIERPVFTIVLNLLVLLAGAAAIQHLAIRELPKVDTPVVSVSTTYAGAEASLIEVQVTTPLEENLGGIEGLRFMTSKSRDGASAITLTFTIETDIDSALNEVRARVDQVVATLPDDADTPEIAKTDPDAQPIVYISFTSEVMTATAITDYVNRFLLNRFRALDGVAKVTLLGDRDYEMHVALSPDDLVSAGLTVGEVEDALIARNVELPAGSMNIGPNEYAIRTRTGLTTPQQFNRLVVAEDEMGVVRLEDVATVTLSGTEEVSAMTVGGVPAIGLGVVRTSGANPIDVAKAVKEELDRIQSTLPPTLSAELSFDGTVFIERSIEEVFTTIGEAVVLVLVVVVLFLGSLRASVIPLVAIPISIVGVLALMALFGFSINTLTLLAIVMAIGLVVDDAIVVVENVHRHIDAGMTPVAAAHKGMKEVSFAVIAMTLTLASVFAPVGLMPGVIGQFFQEFALTLAGAVIVSGLVALTLSPMMCARVLKGGEPGAFTRLVDGVLDRLSRGYGRVLGLALSVRPLVLLLALGVGGGAYGLFGMLKSELVPTEDRGYMLVIQIAPTNSNLDRVKALGQQVTEAIQRSAPALDQTIIVSGLPTSNQSIAFVMLKPWEDRPDVDIHQALGAIFPALGEIPGVLAFPILPSSFGSGASEQPISLAIRTVGTYEDLVGLMERLEAKARTVPGVVGVRSDLKIDSLRFALEMDRDEIASLGLTEAEVGAALSSLFGGRTVSTFLRGGKEFDVRVRLDADRRQDPRDIDHVYMMTPAGDPVPLDSFVMVRDEVAAASLNHYDQLRSATLSASLAPGTALGEGLSAVVDLVEQELPATASFSYSGQSLEFVESQSGTAQVFGLAIVVIFLILAAQFESFRVPVAIMLTVPLALAGALGALYLTGHTNSVYSMIGMITLVGLITKHGILICEFANQRRQDGMAKLEAVRAAAVSRLRPILMTTSAMVIGVVPLALADGPGAISRQAIGWSVIGGLLLGTVLTLFVVPAMYSYVAPGQPGRKTT